jgi:glycosyltransferase involved in cell wall biosynthesis
MNILMFGWEFPPFVSGGLGVACFEMTKALTILNHEVFFIMPQHSQEKESSLTEFSQNTPDKNRGITDEKSTFDNLTILSLQARFRPYTSPDDYNTGFHSENNDFSAKSIYGRDLFSEADRYGREAANLARTLPFDIIHSHDWMTIPAALQTRKTASRPWVFHVHSLEYDRAGESANHEIVSIEQEGLEKADRVIAVSTRTKNMIVDRYGISPDKISVIYNAVSKVENRKQRDKTDRNHKQTVLFLGRITFQKGPDYFVEAAALVLKKMVDVIFIMAGSGDMTGQMMRRVNELGIGDNFQFTGFLQGDELEKVFSLSDLYVMPSVSEPFGISPLEAIAYDVPVIISRQSGVSEILKNALKVDFWDVKEMASLIISTLKHPALRETMAKEAYAELRDMQWKKSAEKIVSVYESLISSAVKH